jgi:hypothetical protein
MELAVLQDAVFSIQEGGGDAFNAKFGGDLEGARRKLYRMAG